MIQNKKTSQANFQPGMIAIIFLRLFLHPNEQGYWNASPNH
ncbi:hypothetical protein [Limnospira platensis]|nr:hypothetical protein [Arthrospira platensis]